MRLGIGPLQQVGTGLLDPAGLDPRHDAPVVTGGLDTLGGDDPLGPLLEEGAAGMDEEAAVAGALVFAVLVLETDVGEQAGEDGAVDLLRRAGRRVFLHTGLGQHLVQLAMHVVPLQDPVPVQEVLLAELAELILGQVLALLLDEAPEVEQGQEVRVRVIEGGVDLVRRLLTVERALARVLDAQGAGDDQHLGQAVVIPGGEQHPAEARVHRQARELEPERGQLAPLVDR